MAIVYMHTNDISKKSYIGQTVKSLKSRWQEHCSDASRNTRRKFFRAINKYGKDTWSHQILFESNDPNEISDKEIKLISEYNTVKNGYNTNNDRFRNGTRHSAESIEKMKISQRKAHARRRAENNGKEMHSPGVHRKEDGTGKNSGWKQTEYQKQIVGEVNRKNLKGRTWEEIHGIEGARKLREQRKENKRLKSINGGGRS